MSNPVSPVLKGASGQTKSEWLDHLGRIGADHGFFDCIAPRHMALFVQEGNTLVVSFDTAARVFGDSATGLPRGFEAVQRRQWSLLSIMASGDTWFRDPDLFAFFDQLAKDGFFDSFRQIVFVGFGAMCGHAACAFSAAAPGANVLAVSPAATLLPERAGFDQRFRGARIKDFTTSYGYAPDLIGAARDVMVLYDPFDAPSAAHAAQFRGRRVSRAPLRWMGSGIEGLIDDHNLLMPLMRALVGHRLDRNRVVMILRDARRSHAPYLWQLVERAQAAGQIDRARRIARHGAGATDDPRFTDLLRRHAPAPMATPAG
jgi:hypothetical protein